MKLNDEKCHIMVFGDKSTETTVSIGNSKLKKVTFDKKSNLRKHIEDLCRKANRKIQALAHLSNYLDPIKSEI